MEVKKIDFKNENVRDSHFDLVRYQDVLKKKPINHSQFESHKISFYALVLFTEGTGKYNVNFEDYKFTKGSLFTLRKENVHKFYQNNAKGFLFVFTKEFVSYQLSNLESSKIFLLFNEMISSTKLQLTKVVYDEVMSITSLIENEYSKVGDSHSPYIIRNLLLSMFSKLLRIKLNESIVFNNNKYMKRFLIFQEIIEDNCFSCRKVNFYADQMNVTTKTLNNICQSILQKNAKAVINDTFINLTKRLIINSSKSLTEISYEVGFDEPTNFFKYFTKHTGISAKQFRDSN